MTAPSRRLIVILGALSAFGPLSMDMYLPGLPAMTRALHASTSTGQLTLTGCMLGIAIGQLIAGPLSDALGRRGPLLGGLVGYIAATAACALAPSVWLLIALRLLQGMVGGAGIVIARAIVRDLFDGAVAARVFALLMAVMGVAPVFAPLIGGQALAVTSWRGVFWLLALFGVPLLAATFLALPESLPAERRHGGGLASTARTFGALLRDRRCAASSLVIALCSAAMFAYISGSSFVIENVFGASPQLFSVVFAINSASLIAMSQVTAVVVARFGPERILGWGVTAAAVAGAGSLLVTVAHLGLVPLLGCLAVLMASMGVIYPTGTASAMAHLGTSLGSASALLGVGQWGAAAAVAPLVGVAGPHDALPMTVVIAASAAGALAIDRAFVPAGPVTTAAPRQPA